MPKIMQTIVVYYQGSGLIVNKSVAEKLKIDDGYVIKSESEFWDILGANCSHNLSLCEAQIRPKK